MSWPGQLSAHQMLHFAPVRPVGVWNMKQEKQDIMSLDPLLASNSCHINAVVIPIDAE